MNKLLSIIVSICIITILFNACKNTNNDHSENTLMRRDVTYLVLNHMEERYKLGQEIVMDESFFKKYRQLMNSRGFTNYKIVVIKTDGTIGKDNIDLEEVKTIILECPNKDSYIVWGE